MGLGDSRVELIDSTRDELKVNVGVDSWDGRGAGGPTPAGFQSSALFLLCSSGDPSPRLSTG